MKVKKIIAPILISLVFLGLCVLLYKLVVGDNSNVDKNKTVFMLSNTETTFTDYDTISNGKYFFLFNGMTTSIINDKGIEIEKPTNDTIHMIKEFNRTAYTDYYYVLSSDFLLKKDGEVIATIKYDSLDFDLKKSSVTVELLDEENILLSDNTITSVKSEIDPTKNISQKVSYGYVYNFKDMMVYPKIVSYDGFGSLNNLNETNYILYKNENYKYGLYSITSHKDSLNNNYSKLGNMDIDNNISNTKSNKYVYVCGNKNNNVYSSCGLIDYTGRNVLTPKYDDETILDYNDYYYVIKKSDGAYLYNYTNISKLSSQDYILLSNKYIIAFKDKVMSYYDYELNKLKSYNINIQEIEANDIENRNVELIDEGDTIIVNTYGDITNSYIYSNDFKDYIEGRNLYSVHNDSGELIMYYSPEYTDKTITKVYFYSTKIEAFNIMKLENNSGKLEILDRCNNQTIGYSLDNNYYVYNLVSNTSTLFPSEVDYGYGICNEGKNYTVENTALYSGVNEKMTFNQIKSINKIDENKYLIIHDNKVGIFTK